jgi:hypothetical protein
MFLLTDTARSFFCVAGAWHSKTSAENPSKTNGQENSGRKKGGTNSGVRKFPVGSSDKHKGWLDEVLKTGFSMEKLKGSLAPLSKAVMQHPLEAKGQNARRVLEWLNAESEGELSRVCCQEASGRKKCWILGLKTTMGWADAI